LGPFLLPLALVGGLALDNGGFDATAWGWSTLLPLVIVGTALVLGRARSPHGLTRAVLGLLGAFTAWTWLSAAWSNDVSASVLDAERLLLYLAAVAAFLLLERSQVTRFLAGLLASVSLVAVWALSLRAFGGPSGAVRQFSHAAPSVKADRSRRLFSLSGSSRAQYWHVAWRDYEGHPWLGSGAGSFQRQWLRSRPADLPVLDAHSLYLETLAELGPVGLGLLAALLALPVAAGVIARKQPLAAPAFGGYVAYLVQAAQDWDWELPAVTLAGLGCAVALLILAGREPRPPVGRKARTAGVGAAVLLALVALGALAGNQILAAASASLDADEPARAARDARWAKRLVPWSPEPWRLHGEALLSQGDLDGARRDFLTALWKDASDWDSWVDLALVTRGTTQRRAVERAHLLNPLEPIRSGGG